MPVVCKASAKTGRIDVKSKNDNGLIRFIIQLYILSDSLVMVDFLLKAGQITDFFKIYKNISEAFVKEKHQMSEDVEIN